MSYLTRVGVARTLHRMKEFEAALKKTFEDYKLSFRDNSGRRNVLMSQAQEVFFADLLCETGYKAICDGRTGAADIYIEDIDRELECKITSTSNSSWPLQADYTTLKRKGSLDFLYVLCNHDFDEFAVLFFEGLTIDDFHPPSPGAREKSRMNKSSAIKKCTPYFGSIINRNDMLVRKYSTMLAEAEIQRDARLRELSGRIESARTPKSRSKEIGIFGREKARLDRKVAKTNQKIEAWSKCDGQFSFVLESLDG